MEAKPPIPTGLENLLLEVRRHTQKLESVVSRRTQAVTELGISLNERESALLDAMPEGLLRSIVNALPCPNATLETAGQPASDKRSKGQPVSGLHENWAGLRTLLESAAESPELLECVVAGRSCGAAERGYFLGDSESAALDNWSDEQLRSLIASVGRSHFLSRPRASGPRLDEIVGGIRPDLPPDEGTDS